MFGDTLKNTKDWEFSRLPEVTTIVLGTTPSSSNPDYWDGDIKWITPAELDDDSFVLTDSERHITEEGVKNAGLKSFPAGTVIFSTRAPIGKTAIAGCEMYCNQGFKNFICSDALNPVYLFYTLRVHKEELQKMGTGSTFLELSKKTIENISVSVPDRSLQDEFEVIYKQADKSKFSDFKSRFIALFENSDYMRYSFDDICYDDTKSATKIPASEYLAQGSYPIYDQATDSIIAGYSNDSNGVNMVFPAVLFGDHSRVVKYIDRAFYIGADGVKILRPINADLSTEFLYYQLKFKDVPNTGYNRHFKYLKLFSYCCPNAEEQRAFLAICHQADKSKYLN